MNRVDTQVLPESRSDDLLTRKIPGELLIYDLKRHRAFCLNETAAIVWKSCNGKRTITDLARVLESHYQSPAAEQVVWLALHKLDKSKLLKVRLPAPVRKSLISRRRLLHAGVATAFALPLVISMVAPTPAAAATGITNNNCKNRSPTGPGGCGGQPCLDKPGFCVAAGNKCQCN